LSFALRTNTQSFRDKLTLLLCERRRIIALIPAHFETLLTPAVAALDAAVNPGLTSITWEAPNIDGYVASVMAAAQSLENLVRTSAIPASHALHRAVESLESALLTEVESHSGDRLIGSMTTSAAIAMDRDFVDFVDSQHALIASSTDDVKTRVVEFNTFLSNLHTAVMRDDSLDANVIERGRVRVVQVFASRARAASTRATVNAFQNFTKFLDPRSKAPHATANAQSSHPARAVDVVLRVEFALPVHATVPPLHEVGAALGG